MFLWKMFFDPISGQPWVPVRHHRESHQPDDDRSIASSLITFPAGPDRVSNRIGSTPGFRNDMLNRRFNYRSSTPWTEVISIPCFWLTLIPMTTQLPKEIYRVSVLCRRGQGHQHFLLPLLPLNVLNQLPEGTHT